MLRKFAAVAALAVGLAFASPASAQDGIADPILFDADGTGGTYSYQSIINLDWNQGNALAEATALTPEGTTFQLYYQANLSVANLTSGGTIQNNSGTGDDSLSVVLGFQESIADANYVAATNTLTLTFQFVSGGDNFFQIYANDVEGDDLTGECFVCGEVIMEGSLISTNFTSTFTISNISCTTDTSGAILGCTPTTVPLDSTSPNSYPTTVTVTGAGVVNVDGVVTSYDTNYFMGIAGATIAFALSDSSTTLPYQQTDPSACFFTTDQQGSITAPTCTGGIDLDGNGSIDIAAFPGVASVGTVNGISGPNTMFEVDGTTSFDVIPGVVPEPASLTLLGLGLIGGAAARRRAKNAKK